MNIITVKINGIEYKLRGEENNEYLQMVGQYVDNKINSLMRNNSKISRPDATILAAINLGDEVFKNREAAERATENYNRYAEERKLLISELEKMKREMEDLQAENVSLKEAAASVSEVKIDAEVQKKFEEAEKQLEESNGRVAAAENKAAEAEKQLQEINDEANYLKEELALMQQTMDELKKNKAKTQGINKKLLSENNKLRYQHMARVRKIEDLTKEIEEKNVQLMIKNHGVIPKK